LESLYLNNVYKPIELTSYQSSLVSAIKRFESYKMIKHLHELKPEKG